MNTSTPTVPSAFTGPVGRFKSTLGFAASVAASTVMRQARKHARRSFDVAVAAVGLGVATPVLGLAALAIRATSEGPVLYSQIRIGKDGQPHRLYKLRTMVRDAEARRRDLDAHNESADGVVFKIKEDPRITPVGRFLRKFSIDELPQLWNVLRGDLTLIGPRPPLPGEVALYGARECRRLEVTPGLTCTWQVSGRSDLPFHQQVDLDVAYIDESDVWDEVAILWKTVPAVLTGKGAY